MPRPVIAYGAVALGILVGFVATAEAQTVHRHLRHPAAAAAEGRQITVYGRESYLTAGPGASVGTYNSYALDTISSTAPFTPFVDHTTVGLRGLDRIPNNITVPGCCTP